jgi:hypothetical protein
MICFRSDNLNDPPPPRQYAPTSQCFAHIRICKTCPDLLVCDFFNFCLLANSVSSQKIKAISRDAQKLNLQSGGKV